MANFKQTVITKAAHNLIAKSLSGSANINFTRVATSKYDYKSFSQSKLESLTSLEDIKQYVAVDKVEKIGEASVNVSVKITNANITEGYYVNTIGLFAIDPEEGEILYSVTVAETADYFPADNGVNCSGINLDLVTEVSNASNVNITVNYAGYATNEDIEKVNSQLNENANDIEILNKKDLRTNIHSTDATIFSPTLTSSHECWNKWVSVEGVDMENAPHTGALWGEVFTGGTSTRAFQIFSSVFENTRKTYIRYMHDAKWSEFRSFATGYVKELELMNGWVKISLTPTYSLAGNILTVNARIRSGIVSQNTIIAETGLYASGGDSSFFNCYTPTGQQLGTIAFTREGSILIVNEISSNSDVCFNFSVSVN